MDTRRIPSALPLRALTFFFALLFSFSALPSAAEQKPQPDLTQHPVYSRYEFGKESGAVDFGAQPLAAPIGVVSEVMRRDRILKTELKRAGAIIRFHPFFKGADINFFVKRGDIEAALSGDTPTITLASKEDILIVALAKQGHSSLVAGRHLQIKDLRGKKIGYVAGSTAHYSLLIGLSANGMREEDVMLVPMEISDMPNALERGEIDAFSAFEPLPTGAAAKHPGFVIVQRFLNSSYLSFTRRFAERRPEAARLVMASYLRAVRWMRNSRANLLAAGEWTVAAGAALQGGPVESTPEQIAKITERELLEIAATPYVPLRDFEKDGTVAKGYAFLKEKGMIEASAPWEKVRNSLDRGIMQEVATYPAKYKLDTFDYSDGKE